MLPAGLRRLAANVRVKHVKSTNIACIAPARKRLVAPCSIAPPAPAARRTTAPWRTSKAPAAALHGAGESSSTGSTSSGDHGLRVVLVHPQIPQNTGNIARTCAATGVPLHLVGPLGFEITDKHLKRAGLDYWEHGEGQTAAPRPGLARRSGVPCASGTVSASGCRFPDQQACHAKQLNAFLHGSAGSGHTAMCTRA